jgi:hypothetical protein
MKLLIGPALSGAVAAGGEGAGSFAPVLDAANARSATARRSIDSSRDLRRGRQRTLSAHHARHLATNRRPRRFHQKRRPTRHSGPALEFWHE